MYNSVVRKKLTRRQMLMGAAPVVAALPMAGMAAAPALSRVERAKGLAPDDHAAFGHAAMIGETVPAPGGPHDLDALLNPPPALPHQPGRVRRYQLVASDRDVEIAKGVTFPAWTYNGTVPGPVIRATVDDILEVDFVNAGSHPHTIHFHGIHPADMDGVFEIVHPGERFTYRFPARPYGMQLYHCHATPLKKHIHKGLYGAFIIDPPTPRPPAREIVMVMNGLRHRRGRREQLLLGERAGLLLREVPDPGEAVGDPPDPPRQPHRVRSRSTPSTSTASSSATTAPAAPTSSTTRTR